MNQGEKNDWSLLKERNGNKLLEHTLSTLADRKFIEATNGTIVLKHGDDAGLIFIRSGLVRCISTTMVNRTPKVVDILGKGSWLGLESWSGQQKIRYETMSKTHFCHFSWDDFLDNSLNLIRIQSLVNMTQSYLRNRTFTQMSGGKLENRIVYLLYSLRAICDSEEIEFTLKDVAQLLGTNLSRVGTVLKLLETKGAVECNYRKYYVPSRDKILEVAAEMNIYNFQ